MADFLVAWTWVVLGAIAGAIVARWLGFQGLSWTLLVYPLVLSAAVRLSGGGKE